MNIRILLRLLGIIGFVVGGCMVFPLAWSLYYYQSTTAPQELRSLWAILAATAISVAVSAALFFAGKLPKESVLRREGIAVVGLSWFLAAFLGSLPFLFYFRFSGLSYTFIDAFFESMSGFTTTGSTILEALEDREGTIKISALPKGLHFWRSFTQWLGGMGIVVLFVAIIPSLRASGKQLFYTEVPGPMSETLRPRVRDTAVSLWKIYFGFSVVLTVILYVLGRNEGMGIFEAMCHTCTTMSTGGFSTDDASIAGFGSLAIEITIIVFMILAGINFGIYYRLIRGDWKILFTDPELRLYLLLLAVATGVIALELHWRGNPDLGDSARKAGFQTVAIMTTTGYGTDDFDHWPSLSRSLLVVLMFVGGCAGSTGGGMKVIRILVLAKHALIETEHAFRPQTVRALKVGRTVVEEGTRWTILAFLIIVLGNMILGTLIMAALGLDPISAMTSVAATLNNIGPGLGIVGAEESFARVPQVGKLVLSIFMVVGRLEVFAIVVLLSPALWRGR